MVGPLTAAEVRTARADEKATVESVMEARAAKIEIPGMASMKLTIRKRKLVEKMPKTKPKSEDKAAVVEKEVEAEDQCRSAAAEEEIGDIFTATVESEETGAAAAGVEIGAYILSPAAVETVETEDPHVDTEEGEGAGGLSTAEDEDSTTTTKKELPTEEQSAATEEISCNDSNPGSEEKRMSEERGAAEREVEQDSVCAASEVLGGEGSLLSSPLSAEELQTAVSLDQEDSFSLPSPSKCQRTQSPTQVTAY